MMYVVKVLHGYIDKTGCRTREKNPENLLVFKDKKNQKPLPIKSVVVSNNCRKFAQIDCCFRERMRCSHYGYVLKRVDKPIVCGSILCFCSLFPIASSPYSVPSKGYAILDITFERGVLWGTICNNKHTKLSDNKSSILN